MGIRVHNPRPPTHPWGLESTGKGAVNVFLTRFWDLATKFSAKRLFGVHEISRLSEAWISRYEETSRKFDSLPRQTIKDGYLALKLNFRVTNAVKPSELCDLSYSSCSIAIELYNRTSSII
ncbi:hypothetical protein AVEN_258446-1 [Araneus ventricosus]|uniref:Uncharacterized protein n=1 Tax=Araneus ventricosus TaxID=182803 RepID=A0A4Y2DJY2_ARAVE|nr:hypothetical protein AVEN_258446-1 [Araneus ventricosus]